MPTLDDALALVKKDPPTAYVGIAVAAAQPPTPGIVVQLKGRNLLLPDWTGVEWGWYGDLALRFADAVKARNATGARDVELARSKLASPAAGESASFLQAIKAFQSNHVDPGTAAKFYDVCVRLVIAANAASTVGETTGAIAFDAFKTGLVEAPATVVAALRRGLDNMTRVQKEASTIMGELFSRPVGAVLSGLLSGLGPLGVVLIGAGLYYAFGRKG